MIKAALALHHRVLPPTLGVTEPNPKAELPREPVLRQHRGAAVARGAQPIIPRRAGVSAFGFGGTDFHVVLEEYTGAYVEPERAAVDRWPAELLLWRGARARR